MMINHNVLKKYGTKQSENQTQKNTKASITSAMVESFSNSSSETLSNKIDTKIHKEYQYPGGLNEHILWTISRSWSKRDTTKGISKTPTSYLRLRDEISQLNPDLKNLDFDKNNPWLLSCAFGGISSKFAVPDIAYYLAIQAKNKEFATTEIQKYMINKNISADDIGIIQSAIHTTYNDYNDPNTWEQQNLLDYGNIVMWLENKNTNEEIIKKLYKSPKDFFLIAKRIFEHKIGHRITFIISPETFFTKCMHH